MQQLRLVLFLLCPHDLLSASTAIAVWLFCPDNQHEYPFIQHYLGHVIDSNATGHYFRYQLVDSSGHPIRAKGVKLSDVGELPLFTESKATSLVADTPAQGASPAPVEIPAIQDAPKDEATAVATSPNALSGEDSKVDNTAQFHAQTSAIDSYLAPAASPTDEPALVPSPTAAVPDSHLVQLSYDQRDRTRLSQLLDAVSPTASNEQEKIAALLDWAGQQLAHKTTDDTQPNNTPDSQDFVTTSSVTPGARQLFDVAVDQTPAPFTLTPESSRLPAPVSPSPLELLVATALTDQARTLGVLASRVETLETQLADLQHERDRALNQLAQAQSVPTDLTQQLEHLQAENTHLRQELDRFEAIRRAFLGETPPPQSADDTGASAPASTEANSTAAPTSASVSETPPVDTTSNGTFANPSKSSPKTKSNSAALANKSDRPHRRGAAIARAENIFHALIAWNRQHPTDTFAMTDWLLEGVFNVNRKAAQQFCQDFHDAIAQHHSTIGIDNTRSHNRGRDTSALKAFVGNFIEQA